VNKVLIAEPIYHAMPPSVYFNRIAFWKELEKYGMNGYALPLTKTMPMVMGPRRAIRSARDLAVNESFSRGATHVLFLDDDILTPEDILIQLLQVNKPIVGGLIHRDDGSPIVFRDLRLSDNSGAINAYAGYDVGEVVWRDHPTKGAFECAAVGAGAMLIQVEVLKELKKTKRWLFNYDDTDRSMDVLFCRLSRAAGFTVWCWPDKPCTQIPHY
jgi:hypothetical protein